MVFFQLSKYFQSHPRIFLRGRGVFPETWIGRRDLWTSVNHRGCQ